MVIFWWFWLDVFACWILHHHIDVFVMVDISGCDWMRNCVCLSGSTDIVCIRVTEITFLISAWASDTVTWPENSLLAVAVKSINRCDLSVCQTLTMSNQLNYSVCRSNMFYSLLRFSKGRRGDGGGRCVCEGEGVRWVKDCPAIIFVSCDFMWASITIDIDRTLSLPKEDTRTAFTMI